VKLKYNQFNASANTAHPGSHSPCSVYTPLVICKPSVRDTFEHELVLMPLHICKMISYVVIDLSYGHALETHKRASTLI